MSVEAYLGYPPANIIDWIRNHSQPAAHEETWYKYAGDTGWRTVMLGGTIALVDDMGTSTGQIYNPQNVVAIEIGTGTQENPVTSIGDAAFFYCSNLTSVTISNSVTNIDQSAFYGCNGLTSMTIPDDVTSIGDYAFSDCSGLTRMTIGNGVTSIGQGAFYNCSGLTHMTINCFDVSTTKSLITNNLIFGNAFYDPDTWEPIEKTFLVTCTDDGSFNVTFGTDGSITFQDL